MPDATAEVLLYEEIGFWGLTASAFAERVKGAGDGDLTVRINSPGGEIAHGLGMYNLLLEERRKGRKVKTVIDGLAASMGSIIAMAGDTVEIAETGILMIHNPMGGALGYAEDLRKEADVLDLMKATLLKAYKRTGKREDTIARLMDAETWMDAATAKAEGFVDRVIASPKKTARFNLAGRFAAVPSDVAARFAQAAAQPPEIPPAPTGHAHPQEQAMSTTNPPAAQAPDAMAAELAELRAFRAQVAEQIGAKAEDSADKILGKLDAQKAAAAKAVRDGEGAQVKAMVAQAVLDGQIAPKDREHWERKPLARVAAFVEDAPKNPPRSASADPGPADAGLPPVGKNDPAVIDAARQKARELTGRGPKGVK